MNAWLNYHHLYLFWECAKAGSISDGAKSLNLTQPTVSKQIRQLESVLDIELFDRRGRQLVITETGQLVMQYADEIFQLGSEMLEVLRRGHVGTKSRVRIGAAMVVPKSIASAVLEPLRKNAAGVSVACFEDRPDRLLMELASYQLDVVLTDSPIPQDVRVKAFNHFLGDIAMAAFASGDAIKCSTLETAMAEFGVLLPTHHAAVRTDIDTWFVENGHLPTVLGEFQDSALLKAWATTTGSVLFAPIKMRGYLEQHYGFAYLGQVPFAQKLYAITLERKVKNPLVTELVEHAKALLGTV